MRIAFLVDYFPALSETFILSQITGLVDRGHEVDIYAKAPRNEPKLHSDVDKYKLFKSTYYRPGMPRNLILRLLQGLQLVFSNYSKDSACLLRSLNVFKYGKQALSLKLLYLVIPFLGKQPYDIIHCHFGPSGLKGMLLRDIGALQGKLITSFHGYDITRYPQGVGTDVYNRLFDTGDLFLPVSEYWKQRLIKLGCDEKKIIVHRMGVDCSKFSFAPQRLHTDDQVRLVSVSRLVEKKGLEYGIRAVAKLAKLNPNIQYNVVGDGPLREDLQQLIQELKVIEAVKMLGWKQQQEVVEILNDADIMLAPSVTAKDGDQEGIPVVLMEAMARGLVVLSTHHSGIPELVEDGVSGFLVPERDVDALSDKLSHLIKHPETWSEIEWASRTYVESQFNINKLNDQLTQIFQQLMV